MKNKPNENKFTNEHFFVKCIPFIVLSVLLFFVVFINQQLVKPTKNGSWARRIAQATAFPVGRVGSEIITYRSVNIEWDQIHDMGNKLFQPPYSLEQELQLAYTKRVRDVLVKQALSQYAITVSDADISKAFTQLFGDDPTSAESTALVEQTMGISPAVFMKTTLRSYLEQQRIDESVASDAQLVREIHDLAEALYLKTSANSGASFMQIAEQYDPSQVKYIPSTYVSRNDLIGQYAPILTCEKGKVLPIIETEKAYVIIRCLDALPPDASPQERTSFNIEQIGILKPTFLQWLSRAYAHNSISLYPQGIEWNTRCQQALMAGNPCSTSASGTSQESDALKQLLSGSQSIFDPSIN